MCVSASGFFFRLRLCLPEIEKNTAHRARDARLLSSSISRTHACRSRRHARRVDPRRRRLISLVMSQPLPGLDDLRIERVPRTATVNRRNAWLFLFALVIVTVSAGVWWWASRGGTPVRLAVVREIGTTVSERTVLNASGYVTARREATVSSKVTGKVAEVCIEEGVRVAEGQVLARLDDTNVQAAHRLALAQFAANEAALEESRVRLMEAERDFDRQRALRQSNVAAEADYDRAEAASRAWRARLAQQERELAVADRNVAVWRQQVDDTVIRAPFDGVVTSKNAQPGEMISPMSAGGFTRTGICTIVDMDSLEIEIDVNESYINRVTPGQPVEATLDAYPDWKIPCKVIAIVPTADRQKSTVRVRVAFERLEPRILPQMAVKVAFRDASAAVAPANTRAVVVPRNALLSRDGSDFVFVCRGGRVELRAVSVGLAVGTDVVLRSGVSVGEQVVIDVPASLTDGARVLERKHE
jgi:RND family efflux transporter MFP subunit